MRQFRNLKQIDLERLKNHAVETFEYQTHLWRKKIALSY